MTDRDGELQPLEGLRTSLAAARVAGAPLIFLVVARESDFPPGWAPAAWFVAGLLAVVAVMLYRLGRRAPEQARPRVDAAALAFDVAVVYALLFLFAFEPGRPLHPLVFYLVVEGALRFGRGGGLVVAGVSLPLLGLVELWGLFRFDLDFRPEGLVVRSAIVVLLAVVVGRLRDDLRSETARSGRRAQEAERLRDELGRRVDLLEAANRCARALGSSLELEQAFGAFIRELRGLVRFDRMAIVLAQDGAAEVIATAGLGAHETFPPGSQRPVQGSVLEAVLRGELVYREDMQDVLHPEEEALVALGLRSRLAAPLLSGPRAVGMLALVRAEPHAFHREEIELVSLLGRLVATGVQNIRSYEAERSTVEELRRLSTLRADFVSLVSHELRSPMAAVIGSARTLQERWRELSPDQRESFLALIADETTRLAALIGDVLDTSRIEAGTFSYTFSAVAVGELVRETVATAQLGQDEVSLVSSVREPVPPVRGDRERLRQVLTNLVDNAVKYSPVGGEVCVSAYAQPGRVHVEVSDTGPGIAREHQNLIFEKFGRAKTEGGKPGTGLGLFIARSIVEAHGGTLEVRSSGGIGTTFTVSLPADGAD